MSFKEFDLSDYITALEDFKNNSTDDVIKHWGSIENFDMFIQKIKDDEAEVAKLAKSPTPTSSGGLQEAPQGAFNTCAPERRVSQALLLATAKKRLLHYLLFVTLLTALQYTS